MVHLHKAEAEMRMSRGRSEKGHQPVMLPPVENMTQCGQQLRLWDFEEMSWSLQPPLQQLLMLLLLLAQGMRWQQERMKTLYQVGQCRLVSLSLALRPALEDLAEAAQNSMHARMGQA